MKAMWRVAVIVAVHGRGIAQTDEATHDGMAGAAQHQLLASYR